MITFIATGILIAIITLIVLLREVIVLLQAVHQ